MTNPFNWKGKPSVVANDQNFKAHKNGKTRSQISTKGLQKVYARVKCPYCDHSAELVGGSKIYPSRPDLFGLKFWRCANCDAYVGCHKAGARVREGGKKIVSDGTLPLGRLANAELRKAKTAAHTAFDPLWKSGEMKRRDAYAWLAFSLGISVNNCHIGMFDVDACRAVVSAVEARKVGAKE